MDIPLALFRKQMEHLAATGRVISYDDALTRLLSGEALEHNLYVITFDDGFEDFYHKAFPLLRAFGLPAILFVNTGFVEEGIPYPLHIRRRRQERPVTWDMLNEMFASGLVAIGAHTHAHRELPGDSDDEIRKDLLLSRELFMKRMGFAPRHFAYPRALWSERAETIVSEQFASAVVGGGTKASPAGFSPLRIPRMPIRRSDGWLFFLAKIKGYLSTEERFYEILRKLRRSRTAVS